MRMRVPYIIIKNDRGYTMTTDEIEIINLIRSAENPVQALLDAMELLIFLTTSNAKAEET